MNKFVALPLVVAASLGLAACQESATTETADNTVDDMEEVVVDEANDMDAMADDTMNDMDTMGEETMNEAGDMADDAADDMGMNEM